MSELRVIAIPTEIADKVRATMSSPGYGHAAQTELATGYGPCRHCLRTFRVGEEQRILFTYDPFFGIEPFPLPGPVFIHADECSRYDEAAGFPEDMRSHRLTLDAYASNRRLLSEEHVDEPGIDTALSRLLAVPDVKYVHVRDRDAGCYDFRVEKVGRD